MKKGLSVRVISVLLSLAILIACIPMAVSANTASIRFGVVTDIHYYPDSLKGDRGEEWRTFVKNKHKMYDEGNSLIENALDGVMRNAVEGGATYLLVPGDLTKDGELEGHKALAEKFRAFEAETGIPVFVIPGNHDVNNSNACTFENGVQEDAEPTSPEQFREIYAEFGYDEADSVFVPEDGKKGGMLSYALTLGEYRLIAIDSCMYSEDNGAEGNEHMTDGRIADGLLDWVIDECEKANEQGLTIVGMQHHNLIPHMDIEEATFWPFVVEEWEKIADAYADAGMHYIFTGHLHTNDVVSHVSDNGETIYDILTPTLTGFPNSYRIVDFTTDGKNTDLDMKLMEIDEYQNVVSDNETVYEKPFKYTYSFGRTFGEGGVKALVMDSIAPLITDIFADITAEGGLVKYLASLGLDLEKIITDALGTNGLALGSMDILTVSGNVMGFLNDFGAQIDEVYVSRPELTIDKLEAIVDKLLGFKVSDKPATYNKELLGFEINEEYCTLADAAVSIMLNFYSGDEDISDMPWITDTLKGFDSGVLAEEFFALLLEVVKDDLVKNEILANLDFNPGELFPKGTLFYVFGAILQEGVEMLLGGDNSFLNLVESVLSIPLVPEEYSSIDSIIDTLLGEYITFSQYQAWGGTIAWMIGSLCTDSNPDVCMDSNVSLSYDGKVEVEATKDNYRLPSHIAVTLGEDSSTEASITWLTKYSLTDSDIQLVPYSANPDFTDEIPAGITVSATAEPIIKTYPGADLGILALLPFEKEYIKHTVKLSGLEPGEKYSYRVGNADYGWWSEAGVISTAEGGDDAFTFFYVTDPQAQREDQYARFAQVIETAVREYPDGRFIVSAGDQVDAGENIKHWRYLLNSTDALLNLPFMPTTGNHEDEGAVITENFVLPNVPEQNLDTGVFYSYDYNDVHFTVLNTNDDEDDKLSNAQIEWMKNDIKSSDAKWKIVVLHKALYSNGSHYDDGDVEGFRKQLGSLLPYLGVDLVLQGHDHVYLRTNVLSGNVVVPTKESTKTYNGLDYSVKYNPLGVVYSICGTSGVKIYHTKDAAATDEKFPRAEAIVDVENSMFSAITVDGDTLYYNAYQVDGDEAVRVDNFAIEKTDDNAPADKIGSDTINGLIENLLESFSLGSLWKIVNAAFDIFGRVMKLIWSMA
ncbi:MAG: metallophosphoesterase [Clostridia bacterium]|nr:metallophosphoesterase [Clostridia bacterium]